MDARGDACADRCGRMRARTRVLHTQMRAQFLTQAHNDAPGPRVTLRPMGSKDGPSGYIQSMVQAQIFLGVRQKTDEYKQVYRALWSSGRGRDMPDEPNPWDPDISKREWEARIVEWKLQLRARVADTWGETRRGSPEGSHALDLEEWIPV